MNDELNLAKNIFKVRIFSQNACEQFNSQSKAYLLTTKTKILFLLDEYKTATPTMLSRKLLVAKPNVAFFCKQLTLAELIKTVDDKLDKRVVYYALTIKGKKYLTDTLKNIEENVEKNCSSTEISKLTKNLEAVNEILTKNF